MQEKATVDAKAELLPKITYWDDPAAFASNGQLGELKKFFEETFSFTTSKILNPNGITNVGSLQIGPVVRPNHRITCTGRWHPGIGHPAWGPEGDRGTLYGRAPKWCVLWYAYYFDGREFKSYAGGYYAGPFEILGHSSFHVQIQTKMNDDMHEDNYNEPGNAMTMHIEGPL